jgi:hypothetical protein
MTAADIPDLKGRGKVRGMVVRGINLKTLCNAAVTAGK